METVEAKQKYQTKVVQFNGHKMTLFSLDGLTWSSRKLELNDIIVRREQQKLALAGKKDEIEAVSAGKGSSKIFVDDELNYDAEEGEVTPDLADEDSLGQPYDREEEADAIPAPKVIKKVKAEKKAATKIKLIKKETAKIAAKPKKLPVKPKIVKLKENKVSARLAVKQSKKAASSVRSVKKAKSSKKLPIKKNNKANKRRAA